MVSWLEFGILLSIWRFVWRFLRCDDVKICDQKASRANCGKEKRGRGRRVEYDGTGGVDINLECPSMCLINEPNVVPICGVEFITKETERGEMGTWMGKKKVKGGNPTKWDSSRSCRRGASRGEELIFSMIGLLDLHSLHRRIIIAIPPRRRGSGFLQSVVRWCRYSFPSEVELKRKRKVANFYANPQNLGSRNFGIPKRSDNANFNCRSVSRTLHIFGSSFSKLAQHQGGHKSFAYGNESRNVLWIMRYKKRRRRRRSRYVWDIILARHGEPDDDHRPLIMRN